MTRILHIVPRVGVPSQSFIKTLLTELAKRNSCAVCTTKIVDNSGLGEIPIWDINGPSHRLANALLRRAHFKSHNEWIERPYFLRSKFRQLLDITACQILHCHFGQALYFLALISKGRIHRPVVASFHGSDATALVSISENYKEIIEGFLKRNHVIVTTPSEYLKQQLLHSFSIDANLVKIIPNGYNADFFPEECPGRDNRSIPFRIVCVGRFIPWKGHRYLIEAYAKFHNSHPNTELVLIGTSEGPIDIQSLLASYGVEDNTTILTDVPHGKMPEILASASVYVQPSIVDPETGQCESFGVAALEALVTGVPTIMTHTGGMAELIEERFFPWVQGIDASDSAQIHHAIEVVYRLGYHHDKKTISNFYRSKYSAVNTFALVNKLYDEALNLAPTTNKLCRST